MSSTPCPDCGLLLIDDDEEHAACPGCGAVRSRGLPTLDLPAADHALTKGAAGPEGRTRSRRLLWMMIGAAVAAGGLRAAGWLARPDRAGPTAADLLRVEQERDQAQRELQQLAHRPDEVDRDGARQLAIAQTQLVAAKQGLADIERTHAETVEMLRATQAERDGLAGELAAAEQELAAALSAQAGSYLRHWQILGPLEGVERSLADEVERKEFRATLKVDGLEESVKWRTYDSPDDRVALHQALDCAERAHCYLITWVYVAERQRAQLSVGSDDGCCLWLNRELVLERRGPRSASPGQDRLAAELVSGWNEVLAFVDNSGGHDWALIVELRSEDGAQPLRISQSPTPPKTRKR